MNRLDRVIGYFSPVAGVRRARSRMQVSALSSAYEAVESTRLRRKAMEVPA